MTLASPFTRRAAFEARRNTSMVCVRLDRSPAQLGPCYLVFPQATAAGYGNPSCVSGVPRLLPSSGLRVWPEKLPRSTIVFLVCHVWVYAISGIHRKYSETQEK
jgi:hypothetical protein